MVEIYPRLFLDVEILGVVLPLLEWFVEIFLFFCGVVGALVVALCAGLLVTELRKDRKMRRRKIQSVAGGETSPNPRTYQRTYVNEISGSTASWYRIGPADRSPELEYLRIQ